MLPLAIVGPTASGKTELGLRLAQEKNGEIISVDARQVYKHLRIGTAKPAGQWEMVHNEPMYLVEGIPYHLVDILDPNQRFTAAEFVRLAGEKIKSIVARGKTPILVGGTGLYFKALTEGLAVLPPADEAVRARLKKEADTQGRAHLHTTLAKIDPASAKKIPVNNIQRLIRALEVFELTGKPISQWHEAHQKKGLALRFVGLNPGRETLVKRIEARCHAMIEGGRGREVGVVAMVTSPCRPGRTTARGRLNSDAARRLCCCCHVTASL